MKRETKIIVYVVIALTLVVIGTSYALFLQVNNNRDNQVVTAGSLVIEYAKGNTVIVDENEDNNCLTPQGDTTGSSTGGCNFTLSITNTGTLPMQYDLLIYDNREEAPSDVQFVDHALIRHSLKKQLSNEGAPSETITSAKALSELETKNDKKILETSSIAVGETILFSLNIWISDQITIDSIGQYVSLKLDVVGTVYEESSRNNTYSLESDSLMELDIPSTYNINNSNKEYRYSGKNPNNYVYFNCTNKDTNSCEVWRILGIYNDGTTNRIKIIKDSTDIKKVYDENNGVNFKSSTLKEYLNGEFYDSLSSSAKELIQSFDYKLGGAESLDIGSLEMYGEEISKEESGIFNVGLMSVSDYAFASSIQEEDLISSLSNRNENNWLFTSENEWLLNQDANNHVYAINTEGSIETPETSLEKIIRPVVYLDENVKILDGDGTSKKPYILSK